MVPAMQSDLFPRLGTITIAVNTQGPIQKHIGYGQL